MSGSNGSMMERHDEMFPVNGNDHNVGQTTVCALPLSDSELSAVVTALKTGAVSLSDTHVQRVLRKAGQNPFIRLDINQRLHGSGVNTGAMWAQLDNYEDYTDAFDMEQAMVLREQEHTERVVDALLPSRGFSILSAKPKVGKSTLARNLIASVLNGGSFLGRDIKRPGPVVYYVLEESFSEIVDDLLALGVRRHSPIRFRRGTFQPVTFRHRLQEDIVNFKPSLIVADPLIKILGLQDVNDYGIVNAAITPLVDIMRRTDAHFLACHHSNKSSPSLDMDSMLGSTAFVGAVDAALLMHRDQNNNARYIRTYRRYRVDREIPKTQILMDEDTAQVSLKSADSHTSTQDKLEDQAWKITEFAVISGGAKSSNALSGDYKGDRNANLAAIKFAIQKGWLIRTDDKAIRIGPNWSTTQTDIAGM